MRDVTITQADTNDTRQIRVRALKRREIREMEDLGYSCLGCRPNLDRAHDTVEKGLARVLSPEDLAFLDECDARAVRAVWGAILKETYGDEAEEKNSGNITDGTSTGGE